MSAHHTTREEAKQQDVTRATGKVLDDVLTERQYQHAVWGDSHDDQHRDQGLAGAAAHLAEPDDDIDPDDAEDDDLGWAVRLKAKHHGDRRRQLVIAAALLVAEIERLDRKAGS